MQTTRQKFNLILTLALWLTMAQTAWAVDPVTKTISFSTATRSSDDLSIIAADPDDNTAKSVITANGTTNDIYSLPSLRLLTRPVLIAQGRRYHSIYLHTSTAR